MTHLLQLLLLLIVILVAAKGAGSLCARIGQPAVFGEILVGLVLGPTCLNLLGLGIFQPIHGVDPLHPDFAGIVHDLAEVGVILLMFVAGMETDLAEMRRVGKVAFWAAAGGVVLPFGLGILCGRLFGYPWVESVFIGTVLTATSVSISAQTLIELGAMRSKEGTTILGAAVIDDVMGILVLSIVIAFTGTAVGEEGTMGLADILMVCGRMLLFFILGWLVGRRFLEKLTEKARALPTSQPLMSFVLLIALVYAFVAEYWGRIAAITGSYMAGLLFAQTSFKEEIDRGIHPVTYSLFVPIFFVDIGLQANGREILSSGREILFALIIVLVAIGAKVVGSGALAYLAGFNRMESIRVGTGMISRGEVGLIVAGYGRAAGVIERDIFSIMVVMVLVTTMVTPILLRMVFPKGPPPSVREEVFESVSHVEVE